MGIVVREKWKKLFEGDITLKKTDIWLISAVCILLGIVIGFLKAPWTHGVTISCGNNNGNYYYDKDENQQEDEKEQNNL